MGCHDKESNHQRIVFDDGKWWAAQGYVPSWEGPVDELAKRFPAYAEPLFIHSDKAYSVEKLDTDVAIVRLIGDAALSLMDVRQQEGRSMVAPAILTS